MCISHRLSNEKPSAIFRLRGTFTPSNPNTNITAAFSNGQTISQQQQSQDVTAVLGLSIEPLSQIAVQVQFLPSSLVKPDVDLTRDPTLLAERIVKHLFNYILGFVGGGGPGGMMSPQAMIPMGVIAKWYENFLNKVKVGGVSFLERDD
jgi:protein Hikeshi